MQALKQLIYKPISKKEIARTIRKVCWTKKASKNQTYSQIKKNILAETPERSRKKSQNAE